MLLYYVINILISIQIHLGGDGGLNDRTIVSDGVALLCH